MKHHIPHNPLALSKQTKTYLLIAAVLGIWGTIVVKIISGINRSEEMPLAENAIASFKPQQKQIRDTFTIQTLERDPFLGTLASKEKKPKTTAITPSKITKDDPVVSYDGLIKKQGGPNQVYIVTIDGEQVLLKKGQTLNGVTLVSGTSKSITVRFNGKTQPLSLH